MIKKTILALFMGSFFSLVAQQNMHLQNMANQLELLALDNDNFNQKFKLKTDANQQEISIAAILLALSELHQINLNIHPALNQRFINLQLSDVSVKELLLFLLKSENLDLEVTGNILSISPYDSLNEIAEKKPLVVDYEPNSGLLNLDLSGHKLQEVFKIITEKTGINLLFSPGMESLPLTLFLKEVHTEDALTQLAYSNKMNLRTTPEGFYVFERENVEKTRSSKNRQRFDEEAKYVILDSLQKTFNIEVEDAPALELIESLTEDLGINFYWVSSPNDLGNISLKAAEIQFDDFLYYVFSNYSKLEGGTEGLGKKTFNKKGDLYFFGSDDLMSLRSAVMIPLQHRSVEILGAPYREETGMETQSNNVNSFSSYQSAPGQFNSPPVTNFQNKRVQEDTKKQTLDILISEEIKAGLEIKVDTELNAFFVSGKYPDVLRFKNVVNALDKAVAVILIEVMFIESNKSNEVATGISWGLGEDEVPSQGAIFPSTDLNLGAKTINRIIGGFNTFGALNIGQVIPEFFTQLRLMEENGRVKILSTPKMATLNGHRAVFSNNETSYYVVTYQNIFGSQIPQSSQIKNYLPVRAGLTLSVKPFISGNDQITLDLFVTQSTFKNDRIDPEAPPGIEAREFSSIIRMQDQDIAVLGGLEHRITNNNGTGVPFISRIPIIKWFFSNRTRIQESRKLTVLIKPTRID